MADRGEQRLRKQMYKPKQFQKKKRIHPRPSRAAVEGSNNNASGSDNTNDSEHNDSSSSSEENSQEEIQSTQHSPTPSTASTSNVERLLQLSQHTPDEFDTVHIISSASEPALQEDRATDLDQFLLEVEQPRTSPLITGRTMLLYMHGY